MMIGFCTVAGVEPRTIPRRPPSLFWSLHPGLPSLLFELRRQTLHTFCFPNALPRCVYVDFRPRKIEVDRKGMADGAGGALNRTCIFLLGDSASCALASK